MGRNSVFSDDQPPTKEELVTLGESKLLELLREANRRLDNLSKIYGHHKPGGPAFVEYCLKKDIELIQAALIELDKKKR